MTADSKSVAVQNLQSISKILWVEDLEVDAALAERELKKAGLRFTSMRVETREEFTAALQTFQPDIILSDHGLPQFNSVEAFKIYKSLGLKIPFILVTGNVSEEFAVSSLKLGIDDYVLKSNLSRLLPAILNSMHQRQLENGRREREDEITSQNQRLEEEVKRRTEEVINQKNFTDTIIHNLPGIFYVVDHNRFLRWNEYLEFITGYSGDEIRQLNILDLFAEKDKGLVARQIQTTFEAGGSQYEVEVLTKEGKSIPFYFTGLLTQIGETRLLVGTGVDISDLKSMQEKLRLHDERMELAFSTSGNAWWDWEIQTGKVDSHSNRYRSLGYTEEEMTPHADWWMSLIHPADRDRVTLDVRKCLLGKSPMYDTECRLASKEGDWKWFHIIGKVVTSTDQGKPLRMIGTADNITKNKLIAQELLDAKFAAESANRTKSQFLANMSHEIRTPLNAVIGLSHLAMKTDLTTKQMDYLMKIHSSSESLLGIINDILDFSKIEAGKLTLEETSFDLEEIFQKLGNVITYRANAKGLEIAFGIDSRVPTYLIGDPGRLEQILTNLCSNAVKFTDQGEVVVNVKLLTETDERIELNFEVTDTGIGMDETQRSKLFQPFTQADDTISRKYGGTGLGLSIIKRLVELMNGKVWVESEPGKGSRFSFTVSLKKQIHQRKIPVPTVDLRKLGVLLVDDSAAAREILKQALESFSFEVTDVGSTIQAIHYLKNNHHLDSIRLVLLDWKMPDMDGLEAARIIRQDHQLDGVRIIMMSTSYASEELYQKMDVLGLSGILIKPIRYSRLYDLIIKIIENGDSHRHEEEVQVKHKEEVKEMHRGSVLLVEDNEINQQVARELLEGFGFAVEIATNGLEALTKIKQSGVPSRYDVVLMDLQMPVMGGRAATLEIRKLQDYKTLPIIAMTADAMTSVREECIEVGMNDFLTKPINPYTMLETIEKWLKSNSPSVTPVLINDSDKLEIVELDGIDVHEGLSHVAGNRKLYFNLLLQFGDNHEHFIDDLKSNLTKEVETGRRMIHTLKGVSGNLAMPQLHALSKMLEEAIQKGYPEDLKGLMLSLSLELDRVVESIRQNISAKKMITKEWVPDKIMPRLLELEKQLAQHNPDALNLLDEIGLIKGLEVPIEKLRKELANYNFESGRNLLSQLKSQLKGHDLLK